MDGCNRAFIFAVTFEAPSGDLTDIDIGDPPKNYKKVEAINAWRQAEHDKILADPSALVFTGKPTNCEVATEEGEIITNDPVDAIGFLGKVLKAGAIVLGRDAKQRLRALASWAVREHDMAFPLEVWRRSSIAGVAKSVVADPLDFILSSSATKTNHARFCSALGVFQEDEPRCASQIIDTIKIIKTLLHESLTTSYLAIFPWENHNGRS